LNVALIAVDDAASDHNREFASARKNSVSRFVALGRAAVLPDVFNSTNRHAIISLAASHRLSAMYPFKFFTRDGGLMSYGVEAIEPFRQAATYVDRILRGATASELPVQASIKWELVINLKTAAALGIEVPNSIQLLADEVIE
jgi:putative tryptophan/tyrosine transport system substrate-binding protein